MSNFNIIKLHAFIQGKFFKVHVGSGWANQILYFEWLSNMGHYLFSRNLEGTTVHNVNIAWIIILIINHMIPFIILNIESSNEPS